MGGWVASRAQHSIERCSMLESCATPTMMRIVARTGRITFSAPAHFRAAQEYASARPMTSDPAVPNRPIPEASGRLRAQGQRHGMGDVRSRPDGRSVARVEQTRSVADGAGTDRGERHDTPKQEPAKVVGCGPPRGPAPHAASRSAYGSPPIDQAQTAVMQGRCPNGVIRGPERRCLDARYERRKNSQDCCRDSSGHERP